MRNIVIIFLLVTVYSILSAQEATNYFDNSRIVKKGTISLDNGTKIKYTNLSTERDSVFFTDSELFNTRLSLDLIDQITRTKSSVGSDILIGGGIGLVSTALVSSIINRDRTTAEWIVDQINNEDEGHTISKEEIPIIAIGTASGIAIGALVGLLKKKEKVIYQKETTMDVFPEFTSLPNQNIGLMLTLKINLK